ncbi:MAG: zinc-ribbon domain-containing protein [Deltaproteobacteria bacterium]|nr:zinc-ribbon domain-containing protein [Deltaproteobacteria bacterium]
MKITCDNCGAKYSIADEKVQGKVFKIRCKKCSNIIVVRGTNDEGDLAAADAGGRASAGASAEDGWHVVIGREQTGPMGAAEIRERFVAGEINADSYVWREGFADWQRLVAVPTFSDLGASVPPVAESAPAPTPAPAPAPAPTAAQEHQPDLFAAANADAAGEETNRTDAGSLFGAVAAAAAPAAAAEGAGHDLFASQGGDAAPAEDAGGGGLFTSPEDAPAADGGDLFGQSNIPSDPSTPVTDAHMTGQRGENSVLFSLANLQALAMGGKSTVAEPGASAGPVAEAGVASGGGSGLIDIRAMAASSGASSGASVHEDELPALGGFASPIAAAPVLLPTGREERAKWVLPAVIGMGSLLVVTVVVLVVVLMGGKEADPTKVAMNTTPVVGGAGEPGVKEQSAETKGADPSASAKKTVEKSGGAEPDTKAAGTGKAEPAKVADKVRRGKRRRSGRQKRRSTRATPSPSARPPAAAKPSRKRRSKKPDELDDLIDGALGGKKKKRAAPARRASSDANLPDRLERSHIQAGMRKVKGRVKGCYDRFKVPGLAMVRVSIAGSGKVSSARVSGLFAGTPTGSCVRSAVKSARFPRCKKPTTITYPFSLR